MKVVIVVAFLFCFLRIYDGWNKDESGALWRVYLKSIGRNVYFHFILVDVELCVGTPMNGLVLSRQDPTLSKTGHYESTINLQSWHFI